MCIAILKPENLSIKKEILKNCFLHHYDGAGFAVHNSENDTLIIKKGFFSFEDFWKAYKPFEKMKMLIHFRWATHGEYNEDNCHPFNVNKDIAFIHNGQIKNVRIWDKNFSDTWHFNEAIMKPIIKDFPSILSNKIFCLLIENYIEKGSKLAFLDNKGNHYLINESAGVWDSGCWFSNESYEKPFEKKREHKNSTTTTVKVNTKTTNNNSNWNTNKGITEELAEYYNMNASNSKDITYEMLVESLFQECEQEEINNLEEIIKIKDAINLN